jgi:DNA-binding NtrC family response regulator/predicted ATPase
VGDMAPASGRIRAAAGSAIALAVRRAVQRVTAQEAWEGAQLTGELPLLTTARRYHTPLMDALDELLGESRKIVGLRQRARAMLQHHGGARRPPPILIQGETGTGKGLLARLMHRTGPRASGPFVDLSCAAIPETLLEAELFGYERGAFTDARQSKPGLFHVAHGGTLFLDEVGLLPRGLQAKLLTVLEQGSVRRLGATKSEPANVSIIAATNESLLTCVRDGRFREDLYHRLAVLTLELPPLRDRPDDIDLLAQRFVAHMCAEYNVASKSLSDDARSALREYDWPGNVRELSNVLERAVLLSDAETVGSADLDLTGSAPPEPEPPRAFIALPAEDASRERLGDALKKTGWNITRTAAALDITRNTVRARIRHYGLRPVGEPAPKPPAGAQIPAPPSEPTVSPRGDRTEPPVVDVRWRRRRVTFLRARILAGPDTQSSITTRILSRMVEKIQNFGGRVNEVSPTSVLAIFGHEPAEDSPRRAASVAIAIAKGVERDRLDGHIANDVSVAVAIHVEQVLVARIPGRSVIDQDATRQASRVLQDLDHGVGGEITVSDAAVGFLVRHFDIQRPANVHGASHRIVGRWTTPAGGQPVAFIGREPEIDLLRSLLDRAMSGRGQIVTIVGEPGIGKSRLLHEFQESIRSEGVVTLEGRCASYGTHVPYFPVLEVLQTVCGIEEADPIEVVDAKVLAALRPLGDTAAASAPYLQYLLFPRKSGELRGRSPDAIKAKTFEAIRHVVLAQQEHRTLVLVTEDLQWLDQTSEELLASLARAIAGSRVLLVATARPGHQAAWSAQSNATQVAVGPLSVSESRQLVEALLGDRPGGDTLVTRILGHGDGNPFFLEELARAAREQRDATSRLAVPGTVHDVLVTRLDALTDADREVLDLAAVIGRDVGVWLLQEASGPGFESVRASLGRLEAADFLSATRFGAESEYTFKHALTHEVAYESVSEEARASLHARVAAAIQKLAPESRERRPEVLARHYTAAGRHGEAIDYWYRAGQLAIQRSAHGDAIVHLTQALTLLAEKPEGPDRAEQEVMAQLAVATSLTATRGYAAPEVEGTLERIRTLAGQLHDPVQEFSVRWTLWRFQVSRADFRRAEELAVQLLTLAEGQEDPVTRVGAHVAAGIDKFYLGEFDEARSHLTRAVGYYDREQTGAQQLRYGQDLGIAAWGFLGWAEAIVGDLPEAAARAQHVLELARDIRHPFSLALALLLACEVHEQRHDPAAVRLLGDQLIALSREHSFTFFSAIGLMHRGWAEATDGDIGVGVGLMRQGSELFRSVGQRVGLAHRARLAEGLIVSGAVDEALAVIADAVERWRQTEEHAFMAVHLRLRGEALVQQGDADGARRAFREAMDAASRQGAWLFALRAALGLARLDPDATEALATITHRFPLTVDSPDLQRARALLELRP